jgi:hypothetical protein
MLEHRVRDANTFGHAIGILLLDYRRPFKLGGVNATTNYPVVFKHVKGPALDRGFAGDP